MQRLARVVAPYAAALAALALTTAAAVVLQHAHMPRGINAFAFLLVILGSAWWGGYGPGVFVVLLTVTLAPLALVPGFNVARFNYTQLILILLIAILVSRVASGRNEREKLLREANELLDERVRQRTQELVHANASLQERESLLLHQSEELARSNADLQQFAYLASHDLQEPLRLIAVYAQLLKRRYGGQLDSEADRFLGVIGDGVHRMETLIGDLLAYSRVIHAGQAGERAQVDVAEALNVATANLEVTVQETGAVIRADSLPTIACDRLEITQVFQNLLSNALKYRGEAVPQIHVRAGQDRGGWVISVTDNGLGINPAYHELIFHPFKRLHGSAVPGTGIGLALCRRIVERHGGKIWVESAPSQGSTFFFSIPPPKARPIHRGEEFALSRERR